MKKLIITVATGLLLLSGISFAHCNCWSDNSYYYPAKHCKTNHCGKPVHHYRHHKCGCER